MLLVSGFRGHLWGSLRLAVGSPTTSQLTPMPSQASPPAASVGAQPSNQLSPALRMQATPFFTAAAGAPLDMLCVPAPQPGPGCLPDGLSLGRSSGQGLAADAVAAYGIEASPTGIKRRNR